MSEQTSHATQPSESDFHDSHPISDAIKTQTLSSIPSMGDLSVVASEAKNNTLNTQSLGDLTQFESDEDSRTPNVDSSKSEILSDIAILDEAYAELEESNVENSTVIPILSEAITAPTASRIISDDTSSSSIPLLNQEATAFAEMKSNKTEPSANQTVPFSASTVTEIPQDLSEPAVDGPLFETNTSNINEPESSAETATEIMSEVEVAPETFTTTKIEVELPDDAQDEVDATSVEQNTPLVTDVEELNNTQDDKALEALLTDEMNIPEYDDPNIASSISHLSLEIESVLEVNTTSIDEKIANASVGDVQETELSDFSSSMTNDLSDDEMLSERYTEIEPSSEISTFNPAADLDDNSITHASHTVGILGKDENQGNQLNLSIPFELHSQLSKKIDELVIDATSSITDELQCQLTSRLDSLLGKAVESVLPKLVNQMAIELQQDVNKSIKQNLPNIINDVLNKTRLHQ